MTTARVAERERDHLVRGSVFLMGATVVASGVGFAFWVVAARLYSPAQIGIASTLISATTLIAYLSLLGLNNSLVRYLPRSGNRDAEVTQALAITAAGALVLGAAYVAIAPAIAPSLDVLTGHVIFPVLFVLLTAAAAANLLTDSVFIALREAKYNLIVDGIVQSLFKVALVAPLVAFGAFGIFVAYGAAALLAVGVSIYLLQRMLGLRPSLGHRSVLRPYFGYSGGTYVSACLNLLPILALPLIVLSAQGAAAAGYFFVAFQIANLLNGVCYAICESAFAEGAHGVGDLGALARRSARLVFAAQAAGAILVGVCAPFALMFFGGEYADQATTLLVVFAVSSLAVAFNIWSSMLLKLTGTGMSWLVWSHAVYAALIVAGAQAVSGRDLVWIAVVWGIGNVACGLIAMTGLAISRRHESHLWEAADA